MLVLRGWGVGGGFGRDVVVPFLSGHYLCCFLDAGYRLVVCGG